MGLPACPVAGYSSLVLNFKQCKSQGGHGHVADAVYVGGVWLNRCDGKVLSGICLLRGVDIYLTRLLLLMQCGIESWELGAQVQTFKYLGDVLVDYETVCRRRTGFPGASQGLTTGLNEWFEIKGP